MTELITDLIKKDSPFIFVKFGDGEFESASGCSGSNCDNDPYTLKLRNGILEAVSYYSCLNNAYCGRWYADRIASYFNSIASGKINWVNYHTCIVDTTSFDNNLKLELFKAIKNSTRTKIIVGNELLVRAKPLLGINEHIIIPYRNWIENDFDNVVNKITSLCSYDDRPMVLTCAGMGSKILIMELHRLFPNGIFIDIGSGLDYLCTKKCSRGNVYSYEKLESYFSDILPLNWNDDCFNYIYEAAKHNIGIHL